MYRTLQFRSGWPNEWVFDSHGDPIAPGARELADSLVAELRKRMPLTAVCQHRFYGWGFRAELEGAKFYHVLNPADEAYLTIRYERYWLDCLLMKRGGRRFDRYTALLTEVLSGMPKIADVQSVHMVKKDSCPIAKPRATGHRR